MSKIFVSFLTFIFFITQPIIFILENIQYYPLKHLLYPLILSLILCSLLIFLLILSKKYFKYNFTRFLIFFPIFWFLQFYYSDVSKLFGLKENIQFYPKLLLVLCIIVVSITLAFFLKKKIFILLININIIFIIFSLFNIFQSNIFQKSEKDTIFYSSKYFNLENYKKPNEIKYRNIYFLLLDEMTSARVYNDLGFDIDSHINRFKDLNYQYLSESKSSYYSTQYTIGSIFNMENYKTDTLIDEKYFYPFNLYKKSDPNLFKVLNYYDYKFWFMGNQFSKCENNFQITCLDRKTPLDKILFDESLNVFFEKSFMKSAVYLLRYKFFSHEKTKTEIEKFINFIKINKSILKEKNNFFWIHNMNPHHPHRDSNCKLLDGARKYELNDANYISSTKCSLKLIDQTIKEINKIDPNAIVVFQGDHGYSKYNNDIDNKKNFEIFNLIKMPESCSQKINKKLGSIATINLLFSCFKHTDSVTYKNESFIVKERSFEGTVFKIFN